MTRIRSRCNAFSLTELLVVIAVILILAALIFVGANQVYSMAMQTKCQHRLEQIGHALQMYANKNLGMFPSARSPISGRLWYEALAGTYVDNLVILGCPSVGDPPGIMARQEGRPPEDVEDIIDKYRRVLFWLKSRQQTNGKIDTGSSWSGNTTSFKYETVQTAMALMAFFGLGYNDRYPEEFADTVRRGIEYLVHPDRIEGNGRFRGCGDLTGGRPIGSQGVILMGLAAAYRSVEDPELKAKIGAAITSGLGWVESIARSEGGYEYSTSVGIGGSAKWSNAGWLYQGLYDCQRVGFSLGTKTKLANAYMIEQNDDGDGLMGKRWGVGATDGTASNPGSIGNWSTTGLPLFFRICAGDTGSPILDKIAGRVDIEYCTKSMMSKYGRPFSSGNYRYNGYHITRGFRVYGGPEWDQWSAFLPDYVLMHLKNGSNETAYWKGEVADNFGSGSDIGVDQAASSLSLMMLSALFENNWLEDEYAPLGEGECSYGYNDQVGRPGVRVSGDTILVMDYQSWVIFRGMANPSDDDSADMIALRHGSRANALFADGVVRPLAFPEIQDRMFTPSSGD
jgi:prepilin-type N-terminal cleavage/methylation domain-containing protein/prepilin-type processing-associated H-X9-DG protein